MRSMVAYPRSMKMFPQLLREAGYYATNNAKEDYNLAEPGQVWDDSSRGAHWSKRPEGKPFFAVFNSEKSHESRMRQRPHAAVHDPAGVRVPAYHPDTPEVRRGWAQYYDVVSAADADAGHRLDELQRAGLAEETIVFYFADHGSGMPRNKRSACNSGLQVPLVVYIPEKFRHLRSADYQPGGRSERLVSFVDFGPTVLSLAGIKPPDSMQGHAFLGEHAAPPQPYIYGYRGRMDERYDLVRSASDGRYVYVRNYMPHKLPGQHVSYMFQTPTTQVWHERHLAGTLNAAQDAFWQTRSPEELYDLQNDPDEVANLAASADHAATLERLREAHRQWERQIRDVDFLPEGEMHRRSHGDAPYDMGHDERRYPFERVFAAADLASNLRPEGTDELVSLLADSDSAVRYWAAMGLLMRGREAVRAQRDALARALDDPSPDVRIAAAEALGRYGDEADAGRATALLADLADWSRQEVFVPMAALNAIDALGERAEPLKSKLRAKAQGGTFPHRRYSDYVPRLLQAVR